MNYVSFTVSIYVNVKIIERLCDKIHNVVIIKQLFLNSPYAEEA
jgi:hypothetical protein